MPHPLSNDLRERIVAHVEAGHSCHHAAERFGVFRRQFDEALAADRLG